MCYIRHETRNVYRSARILEFIYGLSVASDRFIHVEVGSWTSIKLHKTRYQFLSSISDVSIVLYLMVSIIGKKEKC